MFRSLLLPLFLFLSACSIYKSAVRKDFEDRAPDRVKQSFVGQCEKLGAIPAWIVREFPVGETELLVADSDLEIRKMTVADGRVVLRADRPLDDGSVESCTREFADESRWAAERPAYLEALGIPSLD